MKKLLLLLSLFIGLTASAQSVYQLQQDSIILGKSNGASSVTVPGKLNLKGLPKGNISIKANGQVIHNDTVYAVSPGGSGYALKDSTLSKWKNLYDVQSKLTAYKNINGYGVSLKSYGVSPSNTPTQNRMAIQQAVDEMQPGAILFGDYADLIDIDSTIHSDKSNFTIKDLRTRTALETTEPYKVRQFDFTGDSINLIHNYYTSYGNRVINDTSRRDAVRFTGSKHVLAQDITGWDIRKGIIEFNYCTDIKAIMIVADSVGRDAVSAVASGFVLFDYIYASNSVSRGPFEFSDGTHDAIADHIYAYKCAYAGDMDYHLPSEPLYNIIIQNVISVDCNKAFDITLDGTAVSRNWTFRNITSKKAKGGLTGVLGDITIIGYVDGLTIDNVTIDSIAHVYDAITIKRANNITINDIKFLGTSNGASLINLTSGTSLGVNFGKNFTIGNVKNYSFSSTTVPAIVIDRFIGGSIHNNEIFGATGNTQPILKIVDVSKTNVHDNIFNGSTTSGILWAPTTTGGIDSAVYIYNNNLNGTTGGSFTGNFFGTYKWHNNTGGTFSKTVGIGTAENSTFQNPVQLPLVTALSMLKTDVGNVVSVATSGTDYIKPAATIVANQVLYGNASAQAAQSSSLVFDGSKFGIGGTPGLRPLEIIGSGARMRFNDASLTNPNVDIGFNSGFKIELRSPTNTLITTAFQMGNTGEIYLPNGFATNTSPESSNLYVLGSNGLATTTQTALDIMGQSSWARVVMRGNSNTTVAANKSYAGLLLGQQFATINSTGTHNVFAQVGIRAGGVTAGAGTLTNTANLYSQGGGTGGVNNWNGWFNYGTTRVSALQIDTATASTVPYLDANKRIVSSAVTPTELGLLSGRTALGNVYTNTNNAYTGLNDFAADSQTPDGAGITGVTRSAAGGTKAYTYLTRKTAYRWLNGISTANELVWGTGPGSGASVTIDTVKAKLSSNGDLTLNGWVKSQHPTGTAGTDSVAVILSDGRMGRVSPTAFAVTSLNNTWSATQTFAGLTASSANITDGTYGFNIRPFTGGGGDWSIYPSDVTPSSTNYILNKVAGGSTYLNSPSFLYLAIGGTAKVQVNSNGAQITGDLTASNTIVLPQYTVGTLPASPAMGATAYVTDALTPAFLVTVVGGGSVVCPVFYDGVSWKAH